MEQAIDSELLQWKGEHWSLVGPSWPDFSGIKYLIIFGASYTQTSWTPQEAPTEDEPLGVPFPGHTYTEGPPNWVGYLVKKRQPPLLVQNYALGGQTVSGIKNQVTHEFMVRHPPAMPWASHDSIFCTWVGINDIAFSTDAQPSIDSLFELQQELYNKGARNFLFIDVPPVDRSPAYKSSRSGDPRTRVLNWNVTLDKAMRSFVAEKSATNDPVTAIYFSSHKVFTTTLDNPTFHEFPQEDIRKIGGSIWMDHLHPTSAVHLIVANELDEFLSSIPPCTPSIEKGMLHLNPTPIVQITPLDMEQAIDSELLQWKGEHWSVVGSSWPGFSGIKYLVIFGDSYSQTSWTPQETPTEDEPLGVPFPGDTYTEGPPNWVGYLVKKRQPPLLVQNYALGGQTVSGIKHQVTREFMARHPPSMPWASHDSIFCTWVGINDLAHSANAQPSIDSLFELQRDLYNKGARNFLFIDVLPVDRSPAYRSVRRDDPHIRFFNWNATLDKAIQSFVIEKSTANDPVTALYFSSHKVFTAFLDKPTHHQFPQGDIRKPGGSIWKDHLHPTSAVHLIVANELDGFLSSIPPFTPSSKAEAGGTA